MSKHDLELAGLPDEDGMLGRPVPSGRILVPEEVTLSPNGEYIRWKMGREPRLKVVSRDLLNEFIRLTDAQSVLRFARRWGVLALLGDEVTPGGGHIALPGREDVMVEREGAEPIAAWLSYSRRARAVLNVTAALKLGRFGDLDDWEQFASFLSYPTKTVVGLMMEDYMNRDHFGLGKRDVSAFSDPEERVENARRTISIEIGVWLDCWKRERINGLSDLALHWIKDRQAWELQIDYHGMLFPAIALQLALVVADADSLYSCSGCGYPYPRPREQKRPKPGWANYCAKCSKAGVPQRRANETRREKISTANRLHAEGVPVEEIAAQLQTDAGRVRKWLEKETRDGEEKKTRK